MHTALFDEFLISGDTLQVYQDDTLLFASSKDRLLPLLEYIEMFAPYQQQVVIFDKIMGNAAALLSIKAGCKEVYSPLGSQFTIKTFEKYGIKCHLSKIVPYIKQPDGQEMWPMEKLSVDKEPEEFYRVMRNIAK